MFLLKLVLDDRPVQNTFKAVQKFEFSHNGIIIIESLGNY